MRPDGVDAMVVDRPADGTSAPGRLRIEPRIDSPDDLYEILLEAHRGLSDDQAWRVTAKIALLLANHVGDAAVVREAARLARAAAEPAEPTSDERSVAR